MIIFFPFSGNTTELSPKNPEDPKTQTHQTLTFQPQFVNGILVYPLGKII